MVKRSVVERLQTIFGVTKTELLFVAVVLAGLIGGAIARRAASRADNPGDQSVMSEAVFKSLDSLAETERTAFVGTDIKGSPIPELSRADTLLRKEAFVPAPAREGGGKVPAGKIDLNSASKVELMSLPGVGEKTALKIMEFRAGRKFQKPEDIMYIRGIGPAKFEKMKQYIVIKQVRS